MRFVRPSNSPLMEESQAGAEKRDDGCRFVDAGGEAVAARGSSWFSKKRASLF